MMHGPSGAAWSAGAPSPGSRDGTGSADNDREYSFGVRLTTAFHGRFTLLEFARLICLRSHVQDGDRIPESLVLDKPERFGLLEPDPLGDIREDIIE